MKHKCGICGAIEGAAEFYSGVGSRCKECHKRLVRENRERKADFYRAYDKQRFQDDPNVRARHRRYQKTDAGKKSLRRARIRYIAQNPDSRAAHIILGNAVRDGRITKPDVCSECGRGGRIHGHHEDYALPLVVVWVCQQCHVNIHKAA